MVEFAIGAAGVGLLSGWYFYTYAIIQLPVGMMIDRYGARKLMSVALLVAAAASLGFAHSDSLLWASVCRAIIGGSVAFAFVGTLSIASMLFSASRFALLAGGLLSVGMLGAIAGQAPLRMLVEHSGWRGSFEWLALSALLLSLLVFLLVPRRPARTRTFLRTAESSELVMCRSGLWLFGQYASVCRSLGGALVN